MGQRKTDPLEEFRREVKNEILKNYSTIEEFCFDKDLNKATLSNFFRNKKDTQISTLFKIAKALDKKLELKLK